MLPQRCKKTADLEISSILSLFNSSEQCSQSPSVDEEIALPSMLAYHQRRYTSRFLLTPSIHDIKYIRGCTIQYTEEISLQFHTCNENYDTILFSTSPRGLNDILKHMEICSGHYGLKLNRAKCHTLNMHRDAHIHFEDGTILDKAQDATYLGNNLNHTVDLKREISQ